jgi:hypothetical protein
MWHYVSISHSLSRSVIPSAVGHSISRFVISIHLNTIYVPLNTIAVHLNTISVHLNTFSIHLNSFSIMIQKDKAHVTKGCLCHKRQGHPLVT